MKKFLQETGITLLLFAGIVMALEPVISCTDNDYSYKQKYMEKNGDRIKYLVLGNSLALNSFNTHELGDSSFCAATQSRNLYFDAKLAQQHIQNLSNLKAVVLPMPAGLPADGAECDLFLRFCHTRLMHTPPPKSIAENSAFLTGHLRLGMLTAEHKCDERGYEKYEVTWDGETRWVGSAPTPESVAARKPLYQKYLTEIAAECAKYGVRLIVVVPPTTEAYHGDHPEQVEAVLGRLIDEVRTQYPVEYHCYYSDTAFNDHLTLFSDELHLCHTGATLFAQRVKEDFGL